MKWSTNTSKQTYAVIQLPAHGWGPDQFGCLNNIWIRESGWNELAGNPTHAYGIPQADPGSKMAAEGSDWLTNPQTQIRWGEDYIPEPVRHPVPGLGLRAGPQVLRAAASRCSWG